jgi:type IV pilus assembly protein PilA
MKSARQGFGVIKTFIVLGCVGIVAAVLVPAYQDYKIRLQVTDLVRAAADCRTAVATFYQERGTLPASAREAGCDERVTANANPLAVFRGEIIVQAVGALAAKLGPRNLFAFRASCAGGDCSGAPIVAWVCSPSATPAASTTIPAKYLPPSCH